MKLQTFEIPDDSSRLPDWLEQHLMGAHLQQLVTELGILGGSDEKPNVALDELLGEQVPQILQTGLRSLSRPQLRQLLKQPKLLLELQRRVLDEGGDYWTSVPVSADHEENSKLIWQTVEKAIRDDQTKAMPLSLWSAMSKPWAWAGAGWLSAAAAIFFAFVVQENRVRQLRFHLAENSATTDTLRKELATRQAAAAIRVLPADLPESGEIVARAPLDPGDLPQDDPQDLPDIS